MYTRVADKYTDAATLTFDKLCNVLWKFTSVAKLAVHTILHFSVSFSVFTIVISSLFSSHNCKF